MKYTPTALAFASAFITFGSLAGGANAAVLRTVNSFDAPGSSGSFAFGTIFTVGTSDLLITGLGAYDFGSDGFTTEGGIKVGIYAEATNTLVASTNVLSSDPLIDSYRYSTATINLSANTQYRLVAVSGSDNYIQGAGTWNYNSSELTVNGFSWVFTTELTPSTSGNESDYGMGNFQFSAVPEPSSAIIIGIGSLGMLARRRRTK